MKNKKLFYIIGLLSAILIVIVLLFLLLPKADKGIQRFEEEFGLKLPEETDVIFSEDDHGVLGDGSRLYIYQLNSASMSEFKRQEGLNHWWRLPFDEKLSLGLLEIIKGVSSNEISAAMRFGSNNGYYFIKNRYNKPLKGYDFNDTSYGNIIIGVVDLENYKIYYYMLEQYTIDM